MCFINKFYQIDLKVVYQSRTVRTQSTSTANNILISSENYILFRLKYCVIATIYVKNDYLE